MSGKQPSKSENDTLRFTVAPLKPRQNSVQVKVEIAGASHKGHVRSQNQDHFLAVSAERALKTLCTNLEEGTLAPSFDEVAYGLLVADGMGGRSAGDVASRLALSRLVELAVDTPDWVMRFNGPQDEVKVMQRMTERFRLVDEALKSGAERNRSMTGMGTTLTAAISLGAALIIGHIGDSRAYILRGENLQQLTSDHTLAQELIDAGVAGPQDAVARAFHHVLTAALGASPDRAEPQVRRARLTHNDQVLLCTDGLTKMVPAEAIVSVLNEENSAQTACDSLIDLALSAGGVDNITVLLARYQFP